MTEPIISTILPVNIMAVWPQVEHLLRPAVDRQGTHTIEHIRQILLANEAQLWVHWQDEECKAAIVTEFKRYPKGLWFNIWLAGAKKGEPLDEDLWEPHLVKFAAAHLCQAITYSGRDGWRKRHQHLKRRDDVVSTFQIKDLLASSPT